MDLDALYLRGEDAYFAGLLDKAEPFLRQAAEAGHIEAACRLGRLHDVAGRKEQAIRWYRAAAEHGNTVAMINLAIVIEDDDREAAEALSLFRHAARRGDTDAAREAARLRRTPRRPRPPDSTR